MTAADFWTDDTSVLFTSFWGWTPERWGAVGWTGERGRARRDNLLPLLSDPFITVVYVTRKQRYSDPELKGMIAGGYLVTHEKGDRDDLTHPIHHHRNPDKWRHSLRATRAFSYLPEHRLSAIQFDPSLPDRARHVSAMAEIIDDPAKIALLRSTPWVEVPVYQATGRAIPFDEFGQGPGMVKAGPASKDGYFVPEGTAHLLRQLYVLRLDGDTDAYLGDSADGRRIYKIGLAVSPDLRRKAFQDAMPWGAFHWEVARTSGGGDGKGFGFEAAVAGEYAMKARLAKTDGHLGGEFYLATTAEIDEAWRLGQAAARAFGQEG